jgi:hypothetical protein
MQSNLRTMVRGAYDLQKLRIQTGNRIVRNFKAKLGQEDGQTEETLDSDAKEILTQLRHSYDRITDGVVKLPRRTSFKGDEVISDFTELALASQYFDLEGSEKRHFGHLKNVLKDYPIYTEFLEGITGVGPAMAGVVISEFDIHRAEYPSSLWKYSGYDVASDGKGRSKQKAHLVDQVYTDKDGKTQTKKGITFNPWLKTKLYVLATSFLKQSPDKCPYRLMYDNYKNRLENMPAHEDKSKGHRHAMAMRYIIKRFLVDLYTHWRALEGLTVAEEYSIAKLGIKHKEAS